jgi:hypothetical protein
MLEDPDVMAKSDQKTGLVALVASKVCSACG